MSSWPFPDLDVLEQSCGSADKAKLAASNQPTKPTTESIAASLTIPERILLFCLASDTDWQAAGITRVTAQHMMVRGLIEREAASQFTLTDQGRAVLAALLAKGER
jgi:hypothetical protein